MIDYAQYGPDGASIRLSARATANGDVTLSLSDGRVLTLTADTAVDDGHVVFEFALPNGHRITGTLSHGGVEYEYTMTIKQLDSAGMRIAVAGCQAGQAKAEHAHDVIRCQSPDLLVHLGDFVYADAENLSRNGETAVNVRYQVIRTVGADAYRPHFRSFKKSRQWKRLAAEVGVWGIWHDHELFDNWAYGDVKNLNKFYHSSSVAYDADSLTVEQIPEAFTNAEKTAAMDAIYAAARTAFMEAFGSTNPVNSDAGIDADALYFRVRVPGLAELIVADHCSYNDLGSSTYGLTGIYTDLDGYTRPLDATRKMHGATQQAWILASLSNAQAAGIPNKLLLLPTQPYEHNADALNNSNTLAHCEGERDEIATAFASLTGAIAHSNDSHQAAVYRSGNFTCINAGSLSSGIHQQGTGYNTNVVWKTWGYGGQPVSDNQSQWAFGIVDVTQSGSTHTVVDAHTADTLWGPYSV